jgi:hypothetical protein
MRFQIAEHTRAVSSAGPFTAQSSIVGRRSNRNREGGFVVQVSLPT